MSSGDSSHPGLNLLFLTQTYPRFPGDVSGPFIRDLARGLARGGDRVTVLTPHAEGLAPAWEDGGIEVVTFRYAPERLEVLGYGRSLEADETVKGGAALAAPLYAAGALRALRHQIRPLGRTRPIRFDLVHAHWIVPNGLAAAAVCGGRRGVPLAIGLHGSDVFLAEKPGVRAVARWALSRSRLLTGCSPELVERVRALGTPGGYPAERSRVIPYGVDVAAFSPDSARRSLWRQRLEIPEGAPLLLGVGRMAAKKGFQVLIEILPALLGEHPELRVVLAGGGDLLATFKAATREWSARIHFPGPVLRDTLPDLYRAADVFVLPAVHDARGNVDGLPNVILEAMASGLPVVASRVSGIPLAVEDGRTGWLVPERDGPALLDAVRRLLADPEGARRMGERGRARAESELTWDAVAGRYREGYREALTAGTLLPMPG
ncbi:MAG TPA: glycosyltransferase [Thermoanaerobaculia bacterium]|nr:glycosyltransferase [Thermoanaerobaculia bacterium]